MHIFFDSVPTHLIAGVDQASFELNAEKAFHGIKNVPSEPELHVIHFQSSENGVRYGYWFQSKSSDFVELNYDAGQEIYVPRTLNKDEERRDAENKFGALQAFMMPFPQIDEENSWHELTKYIKWRDVQYGAGCSGEFAYVDSSITTSEENLKLFKTLRRRVDTSKADIVAPVSEAVLNYTPVVFKSLEALRPDHKMEDFFDKSWYLSNIILPKYHNSSMYSLLGEFQWAFLNAIFFGNYGSSLQWHNIIELICFSSKANVQLVQTFDETLSRQLRVFPEVYFDVLISGSVWRKCLLESPQKDQLSQTLKVIEERFPELISGNASDSENDSTDSTDEDAPVIVEKITYRGHLRSY
ncbi:LAMI_0B02432g1_1 [Lachancea mirantina]|uniref:LAMI_0B02432g1_1 n=1 Tax=Lachancea mirantina TaxID=1230905 RepID=A0A1G4ITY0_9SACH|nr:LAMI_0B02432g1_1 [Lachancea mirantina]